MDVHHAHVLVNSSTTSDKPGGAIDAQLVGIPAADPVASPRRAFQQRSVLVAKLPSSWGAHTAPQAPEAAEHRATFSVYVCM